MYNKSLFRILFIGFGNFFNAGLGFLFIAAVARSLSLADFGKYALLTSFLVFVAKITDFGTNSLYVAKAIRGVGQSLDKFLSLKIFLLLSAIPVSLFFLLFFNFTQTEIVFIYLLGLFSYAINFALFGLFQKIENFLLLILLNTIPASIKGIFATLILLGIFKINMVQAFLIFSGSIIPSLFLYFYLPSELKSFRISTQGIKELFSETLPAGISQLTSEGWSAIANGIAKIAQSFENVGIYSLADKISGTFSLVSLSIFTVLLPKNAKYKKETNSYDLTETVFLALGVITLSFAAIVVGRYLVPVVFGEKFRESLTILNVLIFANAFTAIHTFMENYFFVEEQTGKLPLIYAAKLISFAFLVILLVPAYNLSGLAYSQLFAAILATVTTTILIIKTATQPKENLIQKLFRKVERN